MSDEASLLPLKRTRDSLDKISKNLAPFLDLLDRYHNQSDVPNDSGGASESGETTPATNKGKRETFDQQKVTEAEAAVALAIGTLRYMASRLKGSAKGQKKNDPLRLELNKMRKTLVALKKLDKSKGDTKGKLTPTAKGDESVKKNEGSASKRKRIESKRDDDRETISDPDLSSPNPKGKKKQKK